MAAKKKKKTAAKKKTVAKKKPAAAKKKPAAAKKKPAVAKKAATAKIAKGGKVAAAKGTKPSGALSEVEKQVEAMLTDWDDGNIDNAWDVVGELHELGEKLPKTSPLRKRFDEMSEAIVEICAENA